MKIERDAQLLRIFVGESDRWEGRPLYEAIVRAARDQGLAGATALRAIEGFGASSRIHTVKILRLSEDLPIVIEIVDQPERIAGFLPIVDEMVSEGMATIENVRAAIYRHDATLPPPDEEIPLESSDYVPAEVEPEVKESMSERAIQLLDAAKEAATRSRRVSLDSVDVLLAMLCDVQGAATQALIALGIDCQSVERSLREAVSRDERAAEYRAALENKSLTEARWLGHQSIASEHLLLALCQIRPSAATDILMRLGAQPRDICKEVLRILGQAEDWPRWIADHPDM